MNSYNKTNHRLPSIVGVLNVTPDSFSDGGRYPDVDAALGHAEELALSGATVIDVGAESTRPGASPVSAEDEWERLRHLLPALVTLGNRREVAISVDTRHNQTALRALECGVSWVNAVGGEVDDRVIDQLSRGQGRLVLMHSCGLPADPAVHVSVSEDPVVEVYRWAERIVNRMIQRGLAASQIVIDPGIGFGKTAEQSWEIIRRVQEFTPLGVDLMIGHSRKSFLAVCTDRPPLERDFETHCVSFSLFSLGVGYLRVHDVEGTVRALRVFSRLVQTSTLREGSTI